MQPKGKLSIITIYRQTFSWQCAGHWWACRSFPSWVCSRALWTSFEELRGIISYWSIFPGRKTWTKALKGNFSRTEYTRLNIGLFSRDIFWDQCRMTSLQNSIWITNQKLILIGKRSRSLSSWVYWLPNAWLSKAGSNFGGTKIWRWNTHINDN